MSEPLENIQSTLKTSKTTTSNEAEQPKPIGIITKNITIESDVEEDEFKVTPSEGLEEFVIVSDENHFGPGSYVGGLSQKEFDEIEEEDLDKAIAASLEDQHSAQQLQTSTLSDSDPATSRYPIRSRSSRKSSMVHIGSQDQVSDISQKELKEREEEEFERAIAASLMGQSPSSSSAPITFQYSTTNRSTLGGDAERSQSRSPRKSTKAVRPPTP